MGGRILTITLMRPRSVLAVTCDEFTIVGIDCGGSEGAGDAESCGFETEGGSGGGPLA